MNYKNHFTDIFESIPDYRQIVLQIFLIKDDEKSLKENGCSKNDINQLSLEFKKILLEKHETFSIMSKISKKKLLKAF